MATTPLHTAFPSGPLVDGAGNLQPVWRAFFTALYVRTGGTEGASSDTSALQADLAAEAATRGSVDVALSSAISAERTARETADAAERTDRASADAQKLGIGGGTVSGPVRLSGGMGVLGNAAVTTRPVVTGAKAGNAALASLLAALASFGLITDSST